MSGFILLWNKALGFGAERDVLDYFWVNCGLEIRIILKDDKNKRHIIFDYPYFNLFYYWNNNFYL